MAQSRGDPFYITTAIDYPNSVPHMGHAYEKTVADFYARAYRLRGRDVRFLTGLDEHGQKIQEAAAAAGVPPQDFVDEKAKSFRAMCKELEISVDDFIRTSEPRHHRFAVEIYTRVKARGDIYLGDYEGDYCVACESFYTPTQLVSGNCPVHGRPTQRVKEPSYFFRLGKYRGWIRDHIRAHPSFIYPEARRNEVLARLEDEVRDLSISRSSFAWGIALPDDPKHVLYVWFDALANYISALREPEDIYARYWPADVHVIGKDIIWFHAVIWPCMLQSAGLPVPKQIYGHGFVLDAEGRKMAKNLGNVVDPMAVIERFGAEVLRYYLLRSMASGQDGCFSEPDLVDRYHGELGNDLGNLVMRVVKLVESRLGGAAGAPPGAAASLDPAPVAEDFARLVDAREHHRAIDALWSYIRSVNAYLNERAPWKEKNPAAVHAVLYNALEALRGIAYLLSPAMPRTAGSIARQLGVAVTAGPLAPFGSGSFMVRREDPLFPRLEASVSEVPPPAAGAAAAEPEPGEKEKASEGGDPFAKLEIRVGRIDRVEAHPDAESLYVLRIDLGPELGQRTICAGLRKHLAPAELQGRKVAVLANLKPAKLRGIESCGMVLATDRRDGKVAPVDPGDALPGALAGVEGIPPAPKAKLSTKDFERAPLSIAGGRVVYEGKPLATPAGPLRCDAEDGAKVR
jgi:methionyl-tRNA synthetase